MTTTTDKTPNLPLWKKMLFSFILIFGIPVSVVLAIEGVGCAIIHWNYGVYGKSYGLWQYDQELGAIHAANGYNSNSETNNFGFRNKENVIEPKPANALRIITYGGSTTFCYNLPTDLAWPIRLQEVLRKQHNASDQVLNGGAITWSIGHELARAKRDLPRLKPDVVIIYSGINEEINAGLLKSEGVSLEQALKEGKHGLFTRNLDQARWIKRNSVIVRYWEYVAAQWLHGQMAAAEKHTATELLQADTATELTQADAAVDPVVSQNFNATLREFISLVRQYGGKAIYVVMGGLPVGENGRPLQYSRQGADIARELGVPVVDSNEIVEGYKGDRRALFAESGVHWSQTGASMLADFIYERALRSN
jgi:lysophospholipase L1-like esterase